MSMREFRMALFMVVVLLFSIPQVWADNLIVPATRVNGYTIGKTTETDIKKELGNPVFVKLSKDGKKSVLKYDKPDIAFLVDFNTRVLVSMMVRSASYQTKEGLRIGSSSAEVEKALGKPAKTQNIRDGGSHTSYPSGINFEFDTSKKVRAISVGTSH
jgi:hypothetical protein